MSACLLARMVLPCGVETVKEEMQATKELWGKTDGRTYVAGEARNGFCKD